jgi:hypothetical protein
MMRLQAGGVPAYFYLCLDCGAIREDAHLRDGTIIGTRWHTNLNRARLPDAVIRQAREILNQPSFEQLEMFQDDG